ncbi:ephrin type-A receptor 3-like [Patiria miniata]|uniref:Fibronectin type-III domain-containing protein n=1 Tax=Patiria miniata TaxID=46514 RepID=A0A914ATK7_PATMI|nr:ephrin type-A receptor 3-like [Patiria miniata]
MEYALTNKDNCQCINQPTYISPCDMCPAPTRPPHFVTPGSQAERSLAFSWSLPACGSRGGDITGYVYRLSTSGAAPMTGQTTASPSGGAVTIDGLTPFTLYSFNIAAQTNNGTGPYSAAITSRTLEAVSTEPTVPLDVRVLSTDDRSVSLGWSKPDRPNGRITHYNVRYWRSGEIGIKQTDTNVVGLVHRILGLEVDVTYHFQVQAVTSAGQGYWSEPIEATTTIGGVVNTDGQIYEDVGLPIWARKLEIKWENLIIDDEILGKGNFGEVRAGGVRIGGQVTKAAIKTLKVNCVSLVFQ